MKLTWTKTDEAPALASYALLPILRAYFKGTGVEIETADISLAGRIVATFSECLRQDQKIPDELTRLGELAKKPEANIVKLPNISVLQLCNYISFSQRKKKFGARVWFAVFHFSVAQPGRHVGISVKLLRIERASHDAAIGVAADDHFRHPQRAHRIFDRGGNTAKRFRVWRYKIANHPADEQLARFALG